MTVASTRSLSREVSHAFRTVVLSAMTMVVVIGLTISWFFGYGARTVDRTAALTSAAEQTSADLLEAQSALRGYVVTGDSTFLTTYRALGTRLDTDRVRLRALSRGSTAGMVHDFELTAARWQDGWARRAMQPGAHDRYVEPNGSLDVRAATAFVDLGNGLFDAARQTLDQLSTTAQREHFATRRETLIAVVVTALILVVVAITTAIGAVRRRRTLHARVVGPVDVLLAKVRAVGKGEFSAWPAIDGPEELVELRDELADMSASLLLQQEFLAGRVEDAAASARRLQLVVDAAREISGSLTLTNVLEAATTAGRRLVGSPRARVWLVDGDHQEALRLRYDSITGDAVPPDECRVGEGALGRAAQRHQVTYSSRLGGEPKDGGARTSAVAVPLLKGSRLIGILELALPPAARQLPEETMEVLTATAAHAATAIDAALLYALAESLSRSDPLTGLGNRRQLDADLELEIERSARHQRPMAFLMLDIDHFKQVNDTFGHALGDSVLQEVADVLRDQLRAGDTAYRYGGEEFAVLARDTDYAGATVLAERLRAAVEGRYAVRRAGDVAVTVSIGVAGGATDLPEAEDLAAAADAALYEAKRAGRNCVRFTAPEELAASLRYDRLVPAPRRPLLPEPR